ncbi:hypothetical protein [Methylocaldum sp.]|uniref:hypothetical protein n=1 Tax=Methylocaldum sp. TaxID=1969727 RepID=UPI002D4B3660|nr:hypothetical protein [Methylocaldum sp.]HYE35389.1 hypothetical protein [Methylocaldum sp.]
MAKNTPAHPRQESACKIIPFPGTSAEYGAGPFAEPVVCKESRELLKELQELVERGEIEGLVVVGVLRNGYELTERSGSAYTEPFAYIASVARVLHLLNEGALR